MEKPPPKWRNNLTKKCAHCGETFWPSHNAPWNDWQARTHCAKCTSRIAPHNRRFPNERDRGR